MLLLSLCLILLLGLMLAFVCKKLQLPSLIAYLAVGIILGPLVLDLIDEGILNISSEIRKIALILILIHAGLSLNFSDFKRIGRPAMLMAFLPAILEIAAIGLIAPLIFNISYLNAFILGSVIGAVSPAVVIPRMIKMIEADHGTKKGIPQLIISGSSIDDIIVIVIFTALTTSATTGTVGFMMYLNVPLAIILGTISGLIIGLLLVWFFKKFHIRDTVSDHHMLNMLWSSCVRRNY